MYVESEKIFRVKVKVFQFVFAALFGARLVFWALFERDLRCA